MNFRSNMSTSNTPYLIYRHQETNPMNTTADLAVFPLKEPHNFGEYIGNAYSTGYTIGNHYSGTYFSGFVSGRKKQYKKVNKLEARLLGHLVSLSTAGVIIALGGANNKHPILTTCLFTALVFNRMMTGSTALTIFSLFTPLNTRIVVIIVYTAFIINAANFFDNEIGQKFGKLSIVKKISGMTCGILNASRAAISWSWDNLKHKFTKYQVINHSPS